MAHKEGNKVREENHISQNNETNNNEPPRISK
jgi:hypothetical protein